MSDIDEELLEDLYGWVDQIPFSRPKRDIKRDFSDGVLVAEIVRHFVPHLVEIHNYVAANKTENKIINWKLMNRKVFKKLGFELTDEVISNITASKPWAVEQFLMMLRRKIDRHIYEKQRKTTDNPNVNDRPEVDQNYKVVKPPVAQQSQLKKYDNHHASPTKYDGGYSIGKNAKNGSMQNLSNQPVYSQANRGRDVVPKIQVEEKEQEILVKEETIQILQAKVRRLEHLLHLKDIRIDDLQSRLDQLESDLRPTAKHQTKK